MPNGACVGTRRTVLTEGNGAVRLILASERSTRGRGPRFAADRARLPASGPGREGSRSVIAISRRASMRWMRFCSVLDSTSFQNGALICTLGEFANTVGLRENRRPEARQGHRQRFRRDRKCGDDQRDCSENILRLVVFSADFSEWNMPWRIPDCSYFRPSANS